MSEKSRKCCKKFEAGDQAALLLALDFCARCGMLPLWITNAYTVAYEDWATLRAKTLRHGFRGFKSGTETYPPRPPAAAHSVSGIPRQELHRAGKLLAAAFEEVGEELEIPEKTVESIYSCERGLLRLLREAKTVTPRKSDFLRFLVRSFVLSGSLPTFQTSRRARQCFHPKARTEARLHHVPARARRCHYWSG